MFRIGIGSPPSPMNNSGCGLFTFSHSRKILRGEKQHPPFGQRMRLKSMSNAPPGWICSTGLELLVT